MPYCTYTDSKVSVDLSIWNIIILLSFKLSVKHQVLSVSLTSHLVCDFVGLTCYISSQEAFDTLITKSKNLVITTYN